MYCTKRKINCLIFDIHSHMLPSILIKEDCDFQNNQSANEDKYDPKQIESSLLPKKKKKDKMGEERSM